MKGTQLTSAQFSTQPLYGSQQVTIFGNYQHNPNPFHYAGTYSPSLDFCFEILFVSFNPPVTSYLGSPG